ncbi:MAG: RNA polymerase sigma factor [Hyphomicrobiaceae bacterium]
MVARIGDLALLYVSERGRLGRLINRIVGNPATAEDLVHDTFLRALEGASHEVRDDKAYLSRIARNVAIDQKRKDGRIIEISEEAFFALVDPSPSPETVAADRQALAITVAAIGSLPNRTRKALEMHRLGDHTLEQIGKDLGISTSLAGRLVLEGYRIVHERLREAGAA